MKQFVLLIFVLVIVQNSLISQNTYFEKLKNSKLYVETVEPPMQLFFQGLAFKKNLGDTMIQNKPFKKINFERFYHSDKITEVNRLYEHFSPTEYVLIDRQLNPIHQFRTDADSTPNGYVFGWKGTVKQKIKAASPTQNKRVADYYIERDTSQRLTINEFLDQVETYQRNSGYTRLLVGGFSSDFQQSKELSSKFLPQWDVTVGDGFETTLYNWEFDNQTFEFTKKPVMVIRSNYIKDSIVDGMRVSYIKTSIIDLETRFEEIKPIVEAYHSDTSWFFNTAQSVSYAEQKTYAKVRTLNDKKDSTFTYNPFNFDDDMQGQYVMLNYVVNEKLGNTNFKTYRSFKSDQQAIYACYDFFPVPFQIPSSFDSEITYYKKGSLELGEKYSADVKGSEPHLKSFYAENKKVELEVYLPSDARADIVLTPYEGVEKLKISQHLLKKGAQKIAIDYPMLENLSYYYVYINLTFDGKVRTYSHLFQARLTN